MNNIINVNERLIVRAFRAAKSGDYTHLRDLIFEEAINVNDTIPEEYWQEVADEDITGNRTLLMVLSKFELGHIPASEYIPMLYLLKCHAANPNQRSVSGATAPMFATHNGNLIATNFFANWKAVIWKLRTDSGMSACDFAVDGFHKKVVDILEKRAPQAITMETARVVLDKKLRELSPEDLGIKNPLAVAS